MASASTRYRSDIDGLRAVAVVVVVLFHAGFPGLKGGFVGVDVFFVISGYLITANIGCDLVRGRFSLLDFYERRARRILPALFATMIGCGAGAALFLPDDLKLFGESVAAAALSLSNVFFLLHTGYFELDAATTPLLHTWSLAVEEQFYIVFPLALWGASRLLRGSRAGLVSVFGGLWIASFVFSLWQVGAQPRAAFYLPFDRAWELLSGALLALDAAPPPRARWMRETAASLGLVAILAPALILTELASFPGLNALAPCLGAALVIWSGLGMGVAEAPWAARLLQAKPMVGLGLISYSLYLWHWPLLVFLRYYQLRPPGLLERTLTVGLAVLLAWASWRWVEQPFRLRLVLRSRRSVFAAAGVGVGLAGAVGLVLPLTHGLPQRLAPQAREYASAADDFNRYRDRCFALTARQLAAGDACKVGAPGVAPTLAVWGDSHADAIMSAFDAAGRASGVSVLALTHASCPPILGVEVRERTDNGCVALNRAAFDLIGRMNIRTVVLAGRWGGYAEGRRYFTPDPPIWLRHAGEPAPGEGTRPDNHALFAAALAHTVADLRDQGRRVYLVLPIPELDRSAPDVLARAAMLREDADFAPRRADYDRRQRFARATLDAIARRYGASEIDPAALLCPNARCRLTDDGHVLYYDTDHLSTRGAALLTPLVDKVVASVAGRSPQLARTPAVSAKVAAR